MPRFIVKLWPGKGDGQNTRLTAAIVRNVTNILQRPHKNDVIC
jgi:hypothetical protein